MKQNNIVRIKSITQFFDIFGWEKPMHPLIGVIDIRKLENISDEQKKEIENLKMSSDLYTIILKDGDCGMQYGRNKYDFEEGVLRFIAPNQVVSSSFHTPSTYGFMLLFHPDLLRNFDLGEHINRYHFFDYAVHEALHLSKKEEDTLIEVAANIKEELHSNIDRHTQEVIVTNLQLMLNYSKRFYERQFITRANNNSDTISKVEVLIRDYFNKNKQFDLGLPKPEYLAQEVGFSVNYLSDLLKTETGKSTKDHIDDYVINMAKTRLLNSEFTINEIAYDLGFNYPHYFSRMFKKKVGETPMQFRTKAFN